MQKFYVKEKVSVNALCSAQEVYEEFKALKDADQESFWVIGLNNANKVILKDCLFLGGLNCSIVDVKLIFRRLLKAGASGFLCVHNHPGGNIHPSTEDDRVTEKIKETGKIIGLPLLDHIIVGGGYYSYRESGQAL